MCFIYYSICIILIIKKYNCIIVIITLLCFISVLFQISYIYIYIYIYIYVYICLCICCVCVCVCVCVYCIYVFFNQY